MPSLSTHVLDIHAGRPAAGVVIELWSIGANDNRQALLQEVQTDLNGRIYLSETMPAGKCELVFHIGSYFAKQGVALAQPPFLDRVVVRFAMTADGGHYHVPLVASPWSYSVYRGS